MVTAEIICEFIDKNAEARSIALDFSRTFDRVWYVSYFHWMKAYFIYDRIFNLIQFFSKYKELNLLIGVLG